MVLTALILGLVGVALSLLGARATCRRLGLDIREVLLWFGLAEHPSLVPSRRERHLR